MIRLAAALRRVQIGDNAQLSNLFFYEANLHRHLDWRSPLEWIGSPNYWALEEDGRMAAALAFPEDPPNVAWIRLFGYQPHLSAGEAWSAMWGAACGEAFRANPQTHIAAIATKLWFQNLLLANGFQYKQSIVSLEWTPYSAPAPRALPQGVTIRPMRPEDVSTAAQIDRSAFGWFWHNSVDCLRRALSASVYASIAETEEGAIGYQISTGNARGAHLARLATLPAAQGRGVGGALIRNMAAVTAAQRISVNTQHDNESSLALYKKTGFIETGEHFPVLTYST
ncbi:MAG: hypothetical protein Fur002_06840 [Anaerolineales bacterium]